jgi:hypothetical protein
MSAEESLKKMGFIFESKSVIVYRSSTPAGELELRVNISKSEGNGESKARRFFLTTGYLSGALESAFRTWCSGKLGKED